MTSAQTVRASLLAALPADEWRKLRIDNRPIVGVGYDEEYVYVSFSSRYDDGRIYDIDSDIEVTHANDPHAG